MISWILIVSSDNSWCTCGLRTEFSALSLSPMQALITQPKVLNVHSQVELLAGKSSKSFMSRRVWGINTSCCQLLGMTQNNLLSLRQELCNASCLAGIVGFQHLSYLYTQCILQDFYPKDRIRSILKIELCAHCFQFLSSGQKLKTAFYLQDKTHSILRIENTEITGRAPFSCEQ